MTEKKDSLFYGAASEIITPFTKSGEVDHGLLADEISFMLDEGVTGLFVNGLASEALMMDKVDQFAAAKTVIKAANHRVPVMGNIIANSLQAGISDIRNFEEIGTDAITIMPPLVYKYTSDGLYEFANELANASNKPVYIYNAPETGNKLAPKLVAKLFNENDSFKGYKDSTQNIIEQQTLLGLLAPDRHFELMSGSDAQIVPTMMLGGLGVISLITVLFPRLIIEVCVACEANDFSRAIDLQAKVLRVREALKTGPFMAAYKYVANCIGHPLGYMKRPLSDVSSADKAKIDQLLKEEGLL